MKERFFRNRTAVFTVAFVLLVGLVGVLAPVIAPNDPYETNILNKFASYSLQYPLGTDQLGRCVLSRMIYGIRPTLGLALLTMFGTISLGAILGIMAGYFRGIVEEVIMRVVDVMLSLCHLDYTMSEAGGVTNFVRQYTLASGGPYCDCGYKKKGFVKAGTEAGR